MTVTLTQFTYLQIQKDLSYLFTIHFLHIFSTSGNYRKWCCVTTEWPLFGEVIVPKLYIPYQNSLTKAHPFDVD